MARIGLDGVSKVSGDPDAGQAIGRQDATGDGARATTGA
jgi:hypothetical protein